MPDPLFVFPTHRFNPASVKPDVIGHVLSGGVALSGDEDTVATDGGGRVRIDMDGINLRTPDALRRWNGWNGLLGGGVTPCLVPVVSLATAPRAWAGSGPRPAPAFGDNDDMFPTEVGYRIRTISAVTVGNAALRATQLTIAITKGSAIKGGEWFSIGQRAHRIVRVTARTGMQATVIIEPPLRGAVAGGSAVEFEWPVMKGRLVVGNDLGITLLNNRRSTQSISFVEAA